MTAPHEIALIGPGGYARCTCQRTFHVTGGILAAFKTVAYHIREKQDTQ